MFEVENIEANKGFAVPLILFRSVELLIANFQHGIWTIDNTNMMAFILISI